MTANAYQPAQTAFRSTDAFLVKFTPDFTLVYSTYLGGSQAEQQESYAQGVRIAVNAAGNAYVTTGTFSQDLPLPNAFDTAPGDYVAKLTADGSELVYASYVPFAAGPVAVGPDALYLAGKSQAGIVAIKVDEAPVACVGDCDGDGTVIADELVLAVNNALSGCGG